MKKLIVSVASVLAVAISSGLSQGYMVWQNIGNWWVVKVADAGPLNPNTPGAYVGADYSVGLYFASGADQPESALQLLPTSIWQFFGATGGDPMVDGAGLFGPDNLWVPATGSVVTIQARVWYNPGGNTYSSYEAAAAAGVNVGKSILLNHTLVTGINLPIEPAFQPFTVQVIPEPGVYVLGGLALAGLWIFRRRN